MNHTINFYVHYSQFGMIHVGIPPVVTATVLIR